MIFHINKSSCCPILQCTSFFDGLLTVMTLEDTMHIGDGSTHILVFSMASDVSSPSCIYEDEIMRYCMSTRL